MKLKQAILEYFRFSRKERVAVLVLVTLIFLVLLAPYWFPGRNTPISSMADTTWMTQLKTLELPEKSYSTGKEDAAHYAYDRSVSRDYYKKKGELFSFDPNTITADGWKRLGLREKTIVTIQRFVNKGGHFQKPEDLQKIYGFFPDEYERLAPYVQIKPRAAAPDRLPAPAYHSESRRASPLPSSIDINTADTSAFIALPGIGTKLAARIVLFREKLGGFYSIEQVAETFGLADSVFQKIKPFLTNNAANTIRRININTASLEELKAHPYIRYVIANALIAYRNQHGLFTKQEDIRKLAAITDELYKKISPYLDL